MPRTVMHQASRSSPGPDVQALGRLPSAPQRLRPLGFPEGSRNQARASRVAARTEWIGESALGPEVSWCGRQLRFTCGFALTVSGVPETAWRISFCGPTEHSCLGPRSIARRGASTRGSLVPKFTSAQHGGTSAHIRFSSHASLSASRQNGCERQRQHILGPWVKKGRGKLRSIALHTLAPTHTPVPMPRNQRAPFHTPESKGPSLLPARI